MRITLSGNEKSVNRLYGGIVVWWIKKEECCGCEACRQICPSGCIEVCLDSQGFLYPMVDKQKCIKCLQCEKVCPVTKGVKNASSN